MPAGRRIAAGLAEAVVEACAGARKVVAYTRASSASASSGCGRGAQLAKELERIEKRLVDLLPVIRRHVYHPIRGGFSIKKDAAGAGARSVLCGWKVQERRSGTVELQRLMFQGDQMQAPDARRCGRRCCATVSGTRGVVKLLEKLRAWCGSA